MKKHRFVLAVITVMAALLAGQRVWSQAAGKANIAKENGYAILTPPTGSAVIAKENSYAILTPPAGALVAKMNAYAIVEKRLPTAQIIE